MESEKKNKGKKVYELLEKITDENTNNLISEFYQLIEDLLPEYLYKYYSYSEYTIKNLVNNTVCFNNPKLFNDPFDSSTVFSLKGEKDRKKDIDNIVLRLKIYEKVNDDVKSILSELKNRYFFALNKYSEKHTILWDVFNDSKNTAKINNNLLLSDIKAILETCYFNTGDLNTNRQFGDISNNARIFCLSENENNPLMWAHYGKNDTGICVKYNKQAIIKFLKDNNNKYFYLIPIYYTNENLIDDYPNFSGNLYRLLQFFMLKKIDWNYECEWRFVKLCPNFNYNPFFYGDMTAALSAPCDYPENYIIPFIEPESVYLAAKFSLDNLDVTKPNKEKLEGMFLEFLRNNQFKIKQLSFCKQLLGYNINELIS